MSYMEPFSKIVTLTKRNHRFYGPTESSKIRGSFTEVATDLSTIQSTLNSINDSIDALASGYLLPSGSESSLYDLRREVRSFEGKIAQMIYIQATQAQIL